MFLKALTVVTLILISYEDFRFRLVRVLLYAVLTITLFIQQANRLGIVDFATNLLLNFSYLAFLFSTCWAVFYFRKKTLSDLRASIGSGDILFLVAIAGWFDPLSFIIFNSASLLIALLVHLMLRSFSWYKKISDTIPLAGLQSICFLPAFIYTSYYGT